jgi:hypothetical protein
LVERMPHLLRERDQLLAQPSIDSGLISNSRECCRSATAFLRRMLLYSI